MKRLYSKLISAWVLLLHPKLDGQYRYFVHQQYRSKIYQLKSLINDYFVKQPYKEIKYNGEFQQELLYVIPFAYWHFENGTLLKTVSCLHTKELYYFSQDHEEKYTWRNWKGNSTIDIPNAAHNLRLDKSKWSCPPYRETFKNEFFEFGKPILVIANRYNTEWGSGPISFISLNQLSVLFEMLKNKFQIIYNRPPSNKIVNDNSETLELDDIHWIEKNHQEVLILENLHNFNGASPRNYNHLQLLVYSNCSYFISVQGGTATLASLFGGQNIIYSKKGIEIEMKEFENNFSELSGSTIVHALNFQKVLEAVEDNYI